ncbi:hypothetical protein Aduo_015209 [Ancylostoma duodenale]
MKAEKKDDTSACRTPELRGCVCREMLSPSDGGHKKTAVLSTAGGHHVRPAHTDKTHASSRGKHSSGLADENDEPASNYATSLTTPAEGL